MSEPIATIEEIEQFAKVRADDCGRVARCYLALHARVAELEKSTRAAQRLRLEWEASCRAAEARATTAEATLARYREALRDAKTVLTMADRSTAWKQERDRCIGAIDAALLSPAATTEESRG